MEEEEEEEPSKIKIKKTIEEIKEIKQMLLLLIQKKGIRLEFEKEDKQPVQTVLSLQLGVEQLGVKDEDLKSIDVEVVEEIRVEEAVNLQQKMQDKKGFLNYHQRISILDSKYHRN